MLAPRILEHFPAHRVYIEPFGGGGSILLRKPRSFVEYYNDLDGEVVNVFTIARDRGEDLARALEFTPFSRDQFELSYAHTDDPLERARRTVIRSYMGLGSDSASGTYRTGFRANANRQGSHPSRDWMNYPDALRAVVRRLQGVVIENRDACEVMKDYDATDALIYADPPYVHDTRQRIRGYRCEMDDAEHRRFAGVVKSLKGYVVISGYPSDLYDKELFLDWIRIELKAFADGAKPRTEVLWVNEQCFRALGKGFLL